jgi:hypothetical protein
MPGRTLTGYAPACLAPEATYATSAVAACVRHNPLSYQLTLPRSLLWYIGRPIGGLDCRIHLPSLFGQQVNLIA